MRDVEPAEDHTVQIGVENFGPVGSGMVELRPLTIFLGPSNTGKTYLAKLIYVLHELLDAFPRFPYLSSDGLYAAWMRSLSLEESTVFMDEVKSVIEKISSGNEDFMLSDLPQVIRDAMRDAFREEVGNGILEDNLGTDLESYFEVASGAELVRQSKDHAESTHADISVEIKKNGVELWSWRAKVCESVEAVLDDRSADDIVLVPKGGALPAGTFEKLVHVYKQIAPSAREDGIGGEQIGQLSSAFSDIFRRLLGYSSWQDAPMGYYLPAARGGTIQTHHIISGSLIAHYARGRRREGETLAKLPGDVGDFLNKIVLLGDKRQKLGPLEELARSIELSPLRGIVSVETNLGSYPTFLYSPFGMKDKIQLSRASAMVAELAPLVLYIRYILKAGDIVIFEEPESHLHPAAQTEVAVVLAKLVNAGVKVVITTHSDWLLLQIENLLREGEWTEYQVNEPSTRDQLSAALHPNDVGAWVFRDGDNETGTIVEEIPYNRARGIGVFEYDNIAEDLYNRSAQLQNRFERVERRRGGGE